MAPQVFNSIRSLSHAVQDSASLKLDLLPYNRMDENSPVWLLPRREMPAFHRAKHVVSPFLDGWFIGFGVEKGVGPSATSFHKDQVKMDSKWAWHHVVKQALEGKLDAQVENIRLKASRTVVVSLELHEVPTSGFKPEERRRLPRYHLLWRYKNGLQLVRHHEEVPARYPELLNVKTLQELFTRLPEIRQYDWEWLDFYVGATFDPTEEIATARAYEELLEPWNGWLQASK